MRQGLFRQEAVAHHARGRSTGRVVDLTDRTAVRAFAALVLALALVTSLSLLVRVDESATGAAVVPTSGRGAVLLLPIGAATRLRTGQQVDVVVAGRHVRARLDSVVGPLGPADAKTRYGVTTTAPAVVVANATLADPHALAGRGTATVTLGRRSVAATLLRRS